MASFHFAYPFLIYVLVPVWLCLVWYRWYWYKIAVYQYALSPLVAASFSVGKFREHVLFFLRASILLGLIFLMARPQWIDSTSPTQVEGIDMMLVLDVSGSMENPDGSTTGKSRLTVAKEEAINFINKRIDDPCGVVIFGKDVMTRCPLTLDKNILRSVIDQLRIGFINQEGTALFSGLATALQRLGSSDAKSKIAILLTDGYPAGDELTEHVVIAIAQKIGVKIYTIGIGGALHLGGFSQIHGDAVDMALLERIAQKTQGQAFRVRDKYQLRAVYDTIDTLEKTTREVTIYYRYSEALTPFVWLIVIFLLLEIFLRLFLWRGAWW